MKPLTQNRKLRFASATLVVGLVLTPTLASASTSSPRGVVPHISLGARTTSTNVLTVEGGTNNVLNLNPFVGGDEGVDLLYNSLSLTNPVNGVMAPELATSFRAVNAKTLVFTIRKGVKWSNGQQFTPADVVFTFNLLKRFPALDSGGVWTQLLGVSASGSKVIFRLQKPNVPLGMALSGVPIVPRSIWSHVSNPTTFTNQHPVVTGPYTLGSYAPTKLVFKKNPKSFEAAQVQPAGVAFVAGSSGPADQLLIASGAYDFSYNNFPDVKTAFVGQDPKHNVYWFPPAGVISLYMNLTQTPFSNSDFRLGVSNAIDRSAVENAALFGLENVAPQTGLMLPGQAAWADPTIPNHGLVTQNISTAMAYFNKAGYTLQNGKLVGQNKTQVSFQITVPAGWTDWDGAAQEIATELNKVGMNVTLNESSYSVWNDGNNNGTFQASIGGFGGSPNAYGAFNPQLNSVFAAPVNTASFNNIERFSSPVVDHYLAGLAAATTTVSQLKWIHAITDVMYNQVPVVNLYYGGAWGLFSTRHWTGWPSAKNPYTLPATWNYSLLAIVMHVKKA